MSWGEDNAADRVRGGEVEKECLEHLREAGWEVVSHPVGKAGFDLLITKDGVSRIVEVRTKYPDKRGRYGLEVNKLPLWRAADVLYTIKDTQRKGWYCASVRRLPLPEKGPTGSYHGGEFKPIQNAYWSIGNWRKLSWRYDT